MESYMMETICPTGIFVICAQVLVHFRPNGSYEKYLKMLVSAMILLQMFLPVSNFFTGDGENSLTARVEWFQEQMYQSMSEAALSCGQTDAALEQMTLEEVRKRLAEQEKMQITPVEPIQIEVQEGGEADVGARDAGETEANDEKVVPPG
jgi:hypothetical protein